MPVQWQKVPYALHFWSRFVRVHIMGLNESHCNSLMGGHGAATWRIHFAAKPRHPRNHCDFQRRVFRPFSAASTGYRFQCVSPAQLAVNRTPEDLRITLPNGVLSIQPITGGAVRAASPDPVPVPPPARCWWPTFQRRSSKSRRIAARLRFPPALCGPSSTAVVTLAFTDGAGKFCFRRSRAGVVNSGQPAAA